LRNVNTYALHGFILTGRQVTTLKVIAIRAIFISQSEWPGITGLFIIRSGVLSRKEKYPTKVADPYIINIETTVLKNIYKTL